MTKNFCFLLLLCNFTTIYASEDNRDDVFLEIITKWNNATNAGDMDFFKTNYSPEAIYYGSQVLPKAIARDKRLLKSRNPNYHQEVVSDLSINEFPNNTARIFFLKNVEKGQLKKDFESYLIVRISGSDWQILEEGDYETNKNIGYSPDIPEGGDFRKISLNKENVTPVEEPIPVEEDRPKSWWLFLLPFLPIVGIVAYKRKSSNLIKNLIDRIAFKRRHSKGRKFEEFIVKTFQNSNTTERTYFTWLNRTSDSTTKDGHYPQSNKDPDLVYNFKYNGIDEDFAIECKFCSRPKRDFSIKRNQFNHYRKYSNNTALKVFVAIGMGGKPGNPRELYIAPLEKFNESYLSPQMLKNFRVSIDKRFYRDGMLR